ncbi:unnamed protein product [Euphydryas editha]|uniref:Uncharacterized protein n=1 Tax=Euphydryas editha TaxID=104508 RepID=A0AAU9V602_EUPED|nr:unnamed protein product [Euphydryas editha]
MRIRCAGTGEIKTIIRKCPRIPVDSKGPEEGLTEIKRFQPPMNFPDSQREDQGPERNQRSYKIGWLKETKGIDGS